MSSKSLAEGWREAYYTAITQELALVSWFEVHSENIRRFWTYKVQNLGQEGEKSKLPVIYNLPSCLAVGLFPTQVIKVFRVQSEGHILDLGRCLP